ncbi:sulfatase-like hydrolase/transferase [Halobacterium noricense]
MFTGEYPTDIDVHAKNMLLSDDIETVAEALQAQGYDTGIFSSNPFLTQGSGLDRGFAHSHTSNLRVQLFDDGFDPTRYIRSREHEDGIAKVRELSKEIWGTPQNLFKNILNAAYYKYRTITSNPNQSFDPSEDDGATESIQAFERWVQTAEGPFFGCLNFMEAHTPYRYRERFISSDTSLEEVSEVDQDRWKYLSGEIELTDSVKSILLALYEAEIHYLDEQLTELWSFLRRTDRWENTLVVVTSDHGELLGEHNLLYHDINRLYEPLVHVPLLIKYPNERHAGERVKSTVSLTQISDTILAEALEDADVSTPLGPGEPVPDIVKTDFVGMNQTLPDERYVDVYDDFNAQSRAVYEDGSKYLVYENRAGRVGNLPLSTSDPTEIVEQIDLNDVPAHIRAFAGLDGEISQQTEFEANDVIKDRLNELGYR